MFGRFGLDGFVSTRVSGWGLSLQGLGFWLCRVSDLLTDLGPGLSDLVCLLTNASVSFGLRHMPDILRTLNEKLHKAQNFGFGLGS